MRMVILNGAIARRWAIARWNGRYRNIYQLVEPRKNWTNTIGWVLSN
jgi:hypothetical protein